MDKEFAHLLSKAVKDYVALSEERIQSKISLVERAIADLPKPEKGEKGDRGEPGEKGAEGMPGKDGNSFAEEDVINIVSKYIDSKLSDIQEAVLKLIPEPKDGKDGKDGLPGAAGKDAEPVDPEAIAKAMEGHFAKWALDFERKADGILSKSIDKIPAPKDGKDGRDALELKDFDIFLGQDNRTITFTLNNGTDSVEKQITLPVILDKGVFKNGLSYTKGDAVSFGGSLWIAQRDDIVSKPGTNDEWRLSVKRGRDGRESVVVPIVNKAVKIKDKKNGDVSQSDAG